MPFRIIITLLVIIEQLLLSHNKLSTEQRLNNDHSLRVNNATSKQLINVKRKSCHARRSNERIKHTVRSSTANTHKHYNLTFVSLTPDSCSKNLTATHRMRVASEILLCLEMS